MINHIEVTTVFVSDLDKALAFYTETLGMQVKIDTVMGDNFRWIEVMPEGAQTSINLALPFTEAVTPGNPTGLIFDTSDVRALHETLTAKGVTFTQAPEEQPWGGIMAAFTDPDGNQFNVAQQG